MGPSRYLREEKYRLSRPLVRGMERALSMLDPLSSGPAVGITLCSSFLGFYSHAGFLAGLQAGGVPLRHLAGASSGAMVAGFAAAGWAPQDMLELMVCREFRYAFLELGHLCTVPFRHLLFRRSGTALTTGRKALALLKHHLGERQIEDCPQAELALAVTNLTLGRTEIRTTGPLAETIIASCAYPSLVEHQPLGECLYWDGGVANEGPFCQWIGRTGFPILVHSVGAPTAVSVAGKCGRIGLRAGFLRSHDAVETELFRLRHLLAAQHGQTVTRWNTLTKRPFLFISEAAGRANFTAGERVGRAAAAALSGSVHPNV